MTLVHGQLLVLTASVFVGLAFTRLRPVMLFSAVGLALVLLGQLEVERLLQLAANPAVISLLLLILVSAGMEKTRLLSWLSLKLFRGGYLATLTRTSIGAMVSSAFLNNTAVVAALMGRIRSHRDQPPSRLLLPLSYAAILGGTLTLVGTSTNLIVNSFLVELGQPPLALFDFLPVGLVACGVGFVVLLLVSPTLPIHSVEEETPDSYFIDAKIEPNSPLIGRSVEANGLRSLERLYLAEVVRGEQLISPVTPQTELQAGDKLVFCGDVRAVGLLERFKGLTLFAHSSGELQRNLTEVVVSPTSTVIGQTLKSSDFRARFGAAVVAMRRRGQVLSGKLGQIPLQAGDLLVLSCADPKGLTAQARHFVVVGDAELSPNLSLWQELMTVAGFVTALGLSAAGMLDLAASLGLLLLVMLSFGVLNASEVRSRFPFEIWMIITGALAMADSLAQSGLATLASNWLHQLFNGEGVWVAYVGVFFISLLLTELMTNNAAAALALPLALGLASAFGVSALPFVMAVAYGASASFISPFSYQTHLMVMSLGNYRKRDFVKMGLPLSLAYSASVLWAIPYVFPF